MNNRKIEYELSQFTYDVFNIFKSMICPMTEVFIRSNCKTNVAHTSTNLLNINFDDIFNQYIFLYNNNDIVNYMLYTKRFILEVIIHELYHVEQSSIHIFYNSDEEYRREVEKDVIYRTLIMILQNSVFIKEKFNIEIDEGEIRYRLEKIFSSYIPDYTRIYENKYSYAINIIAALLRYSDRRFSQLDDFIKNLDSYKNVFVNLNGVLYILKENFVYNNNYNELNILCRKYTEFTTGREDINVDVLYNNNTETYTIRVIDYRKISIFSNLKEV